MTVIPIGGIKELKMALKKKGTPEKLNVVADDNLLEKFRKLVEKATTSDVKIVKESKQKKSK
jgi:hypothetical protein